MDQIKTNFVNEVWKTICKGENKGKFAGKDYYVEPVNPIEARVYCGGFAFCVVGDNLF
jgi:hypothetical protein